MSDIIIFLINQINALFGSASIDMGAHLALGFLLLSISFLYLLFCVNRHNEGPLGQLRNFFFNTLPENFHRCLTKIPGGVRCSERIVKFTKYICSDSNPFIMLIYLFLAIVGFYIYVTTAFPHCPGPLIPAYHKTTASIIMVLCYWSYFMAAFVNPGRIPTTNSPEYYSALKRFKPDGVIFRKLQICRTCKIEKPARSKHCRTCDVCIEKFDHHCVWINSCVGLNNYRYFLMFLFFHLLITMYGSWAGVQLFRQVSEERDLWNKKIVEEDGVEREADFRAVLKYWVTEE